MTSIQAFCFVKVQKGHLSSVIEEVRKIKKIQELFVLTGDYDMVIEFMVEDPQELYQIWVESLDQIDGIVETNTHIVMKKVEL